MVLLDPVVELVATIQVLLISFGLIVFVKAETYFLFGLNCFALGTSRLVVLWPVESGFDGIACLLVYDLLVILLLILPVLFILALRYYLLRSLLVISTVGILTSGGAVASSRLESHLLLLYLIHLTGVIFREVGLRVDAVISLAAIC